MPWTIMEPGDRKKGKRKMRVDFFYTLLRLSRTQPKIKGLTGLASPLIFLAGAIPSRAMKRPSRVKPGTF